MAALFVLQRRLVGWEGMPRIEVFALGPLIVLGGAVLGVAVARWLPWAVFGWVAVVATFVLQVAYGEADPRFRWLHFSSHGNDTAFDLPELQVDRHGWHLLYVAGALLLVAAIALLRSPPSGTRVALLGVSVAMVAVGVQGQLRSPTATQIDELARRLEDPVATQTCEAIGAVTYCSWPRYASVHEGWSGPVEAVLARVPDAVVDRPGRFVVSQRPDLRVRSRIDPDLRSQVDPRLVFRREPVVHAPYEWPEPSWSMDHSDRRRDFDLGYATALVAVGLPDRPWWDESNADPSWATRRLHVDAGSGDIRWVSDALQTCRAGGEARSVVALWLAGQATDAPELVLTQAFGDGGGGDLVELFPDEPYDTSVPPLLPTYGTLTTGDDVRGAIALSRMPVDHVTEVVRGNWDELVDPATSVGRLFELVGQDAPDATPPSSLAHGAIIPPVSRCADLPPPPTERAMNAGSIASRADRLHRFRQLLAPAAPHVVRSMRWPALPISWAIAAVYLARTRADPATDAIVVSMLVAAGLAFVVADAAAVTVASSPTARCERVALRLVLTVPAATLAWIVLLRAGARLGRHPWSDGDAWLVFATCTGIVLVAELWWATPGSSGGLVGVPVLLALDVLARQLPGRLAVYPVADHRWRWVIGLVLLGGAMVSTLRDPARVRAGRAPQRTG